MGGIISHTPVSQAPFPPTLQIFQGLLSGIRRFIKAYYPDTPQTTRETHPGIRRCLQRQYPGALRIYQATKVRYRPALPGVILLYPRISQAPIDRYTPDLSGAICLYIPDQADTEMRHSRAFPGSTMGQLGIRRRAHASYPRGRTIYQEPCARYTPATRRKNRVCYAGSTWRHTLYPRRPRGDYR